MERVETGRVLPSDYGVTVGVRIRGAWHNVFLSPARQALAYFILATPSKRRRMIAEYARRHGEDPVELWHAFREGVGSERALRTGGRGALEGVKRDGRYLSGRVLSLSQEEPRLVSLVVGDQGDRDFTRVPHRCSCPLFQHEGLNVSRAMTDIYDVHTLALDTALDMDDRRRWSAKENYTGLTRSQRGPRSGRIFRFGLDELTTVWVRRFVHREPFHTLSRDTLENPSSYTLAFRHAFRRRAARFTTLRLRSEDVRATGSLREHYASVLRVLGQIQEALGREHRFMGYAREFQGTPWETLGHRYEGRNVAYTICAWREQENPPVVVRRELQRAPLAEKWCAVRDTREDHPVARIGAWYDSVDDVTRRVGPTRVYVPGAHEHGVRVSKRLARTYERLSTSLSSTII